MNRSIGSQVHTPSFPGCLQRVVSLPVASWASNSTTVSVDGVTSSNTVFVAPAPASYNDYSKAGIVCTAQGAGTITFTCSITPTAAISVNVAIIP